MCGSKILDNKLTRPLGCCVGASVSCYTRCGLVWSSLGCNAMKSVVVGMYNTVSGVKLIVDMVHYIPII